MLICKNELEKKESFCFSFISFVVYFYGIVWGGSLSISVLNNSCYCYCTSIFRKQPVHNPAEFGCRPCHCVPHLLELVFEWTQGVLTTLASMACHTWPPPFGTHLKKEAPQKFYHNPVKWRTLSSSRFHFDQRTDNEAIMKLRWQGWPKTLTNLDLK